jgi:hypothetical protein
VARSRRGSFGLPVRVVPNVEAQIIALAREYVAKRDSLIMDAWRNGGTFEGKKATDQMVEAYWKEREVGLDKNDPEYEQAKDQVMQLEYGIAQSKADVLHVQGKLSDTAYAQFFLKWAQKIPANSEFYRTLQKDAAQLIEQAKNKARVNGERLKTEAFNKFVSDTTAKDIAIGDAMTTALDRLSKETGLSVTDNGDELLGMLTSDVKANPDQYRALLDTIHKGDPRWDGQLTEGYFTQHLKSAVQGYDLIADRAQKDGYVSAYASATQGMASMSSWGQNVKVWPAAHSYNDIMSAALKVYNDPNASQMDKQNAAASASAQLTALGKTPGIDAGTKTMIDADALRLLGQDGGDAPSFGATMLGRNGVDPNMAMQLGAWAKTSAEMQANPTAWAYAPVDKNGNFDATGQGALGMVPAGAVQPGAVGVMVPGADGKAVLAMVMPHSVYTTNPNDPSASPKLAGYQISYNVGGKAITMWGYSDNAGHPHWSLTSPLVEGASTNVDNKGDVYVTAPRTAANDPVALAAAFDAQHGTHLADQMKTQLDNKSSSVDGVSVKSNTLDAKGHTTQTIEMSYKNGQFSINQTDNVLDKDGHVTGSTTTPVTVTGATPQTNAFSASRLSAGDLVGITFSSPLQASVSAATYTQTQDQVSRFASDPAFQQAFLSQTMQTLGTQNPFDPRIAAAWKAVTTATPQTYDSRTPMSAAERADLRYPGVETNKAATKGTLTVNFGSVGELKLPGLPSYLGNQNANLSPLGGVAGVGSALLGNIIPGLGAPPQQPQGSPAPTVTPTAVAPSGTGVTPTNVPTPTPVAPAPVPAPTSSPTPYTPPGHGPVAF